MSLVPYAGNANTYLAALEKFAQFRNAKKIQNAWRTYRAYKPKIDAGLRWMSGEFSRVKRLRTGQRVRTGTRAGDGSGFKISQPCRKTAIRFDTVLHQRRLESKDISNPTDGGTTDRAAEVVNFAGWKICMNVHNISGRIEGENATSIYFNWAIVRPRNALLISGTDFFRTDGYNRGTNFDGAFSGLEYHCLPINPDKFEVLRHYRRTLSTNSARDTDKQFFTYMEYIKLNRQLRYNDENPSVPCTTPFYLVYWCDNVKSPSNTAHYPTYNREGVDITFRVVSFFRSAMPS